MYLQCSQIGQDTFKIDPIPALREKLANHYVSRLRYHVQCLLTQLKKSDVAAGLISACQRFLSGKISPIGLVKYVDGLVESKEAISLIKNSFEPRWKRISDEIECICRPQLACDSFCRVAHDVPAFQILKIELLTGFSARMVKQSTSCLSRFSSDRKSHMELKTELAKPKWVHSEMRMTTYLLSHGMESQVFPYLGISKKTCFPCGFMIQQLGRFLTRGNHGKIYSQWTLPSFVVLPLEHARSWQLAIRQLQETLRSEATREKLPALQAIKESTISTPVAPRLRKGNIFTRYVPEPASQERESEWLGLFSKRRASAQ